MLTFIIGSSGSGKTYTAYTRVIQEAREYPERNFLILVPEQFTLQTQRELVMQHPGKGIMNIDVLSFLRLSFRVFDEVQTKQHMILEDMGKSLIVKKILMEKQHELRFFSGNVKRQGFADEMKSVLSELLQYGIDEERFQQMKEAAEGHPVLSRKLHDIEIVRKGFHDFLRERYITTEGIYDLLSEEAAKSKILRDSVIVLDGYTGFTPSQYHLLEALMRYAKQVYVTVTMDYREVSRRQKEHQLFFLSRKTMDKLTQLAANVHCEVTEPLVLTGTPHRFMDSPALAALERNLFRYPQKVYEEDTKELSVISSASPAAEVGYTVYEVKRLVRNGMRYREIAIICGDLGTYGRLLQKEFDKAGMPVFLDSKRTVLTNPLVELLRSLLELSEGDFRYEQVFRWAKCPLSEITTEECDRLENYVLALGIRGKYRWEKQWEQGRKNTTPETLEEINAIRLKVMGALLPVLSVLSGKTGVAEKIQALRDYVERYRLEERLQELLPEEVPDNADLYEKREILSMKKEYEQVGHLTEEILQRAEELLGNEILSPREFREILETGFSEAKVGLIPPGIDQIVIGDIERTRLMGIRVLFFIGVNEGVVPAGKDNQGIINDGDRSFFEEHGIELSPTLRRLSYTSEFYLYLNLTKPGQKLFLSYAGHPSYLIGRVRAVFPKLSVQAVEKMIPEGEFLLKADKGKSTLISEIRDFREGKDSPRLKELLYLWNQEGYDARPWVEAAFYLAPQKKISMESALRLYGNVLPGSVTRLERYASCALAHFLSYGLRLEERKVFQLSMPDIGTIFHTALELFSTKLSERGFNWLTVPEEEMNELSGLSTREAANEYGNGILQSSKRNEYFISRVDKIMRRTLKTIRWQLQYGRFEPEYFEESFLYTNRYLSLRGRIDRIDTYREGNTCYVKVTDYKSGNTGFDLVKLYYGLQIQLGVYLGATLNMVREQNPGIDVVPAGIFYYRLNNPLVAKSDHAEEEIRKLLRPNGLVNRDTKILRLLDRRLEPSGTEDNSETDGLRPSYVSDSIPVETKEDCTLSSRSLAVPEDQMLLLTEYLDSMMLRFGKEILDGEASANPYRYGQGEACAYCEYQQVCSFDTLSGKRCRILKKKSSEEIWHEIGQENNRK